MNIHSVYNNLSFDLGRVKETPIKRMFLMRPTFGKAGISKTVIPFICNNAVFRKCRTNERRLLKFHRLSQEEKKRRFVFGAEIRDCFLNNFRSGEILQFDRVLVEYKIHFDYIVYQNEPIH